MAMKQAVTSTAGGGAYRVCVLGCGAIGLQLAARLSLGGKASVLAVARGATLEALRKKGAVTLLSPAGAPQDAVVDAVSTEDVDGLPFDALVVALKANQMSSAVPVLGRLLAGKDPALPVFFALNGIPWYYFFGIDGPHRDKRLPMMDPGDLLWETVKPTRAVHVICLTACHVPEPGTVQVNSHADTFNICEPSGPTVAQRGEAFSSALEAGGAKAPIKPDMRREIWFKLLGNISFNPLSVLTRGKLSQMSQDEDFREGIVKPVMVEAMAVARALGVNVEGWPDLDSRIAIVKRNHHQTSMLQDFLAGRELETDAIIGQVCAFAKEFGVSTPLLHTTLTMLRAADTYDKASRENGAEQASPPKKRKLDS